MEITTQIVLYIALFCFIHVELMTLSKWLMRREVLYRVWVYNFYRLPCTPIKPTGGVILTRFIPVLLTGWVLPLIYLSYKSCVWLYRHRPR